MATVPWIGQANYHDARNPEGGLPLRELLAVLRRRRRTILWVVVIFTSLATLMGLRVTKIYTATAEVVIEPRESQIVNVEKVAQGLPVGDSALIETQIIESRDVLGRAVDRLNLLRDPEFASGHAGRADQAVGGPLPIIVAWLPSWIAERLDGRWAMAAGLATAVPSTPRRSWACPTPPPLPPAPTSWCSSSNAKWDRTKRDAAVTALKELDGVLAEDAGVVLTQVNLKKHASYAYGDAGQYNNEYRKYYST